jgi:hypothetical protein
MGATATINSKPSLYTMPVITETFTTSGTFVAPANVYFVKVECIGAGGSGGASSRGGGRGGGGSGGNYAMKFAIPVVPGQSYPVVVGVGANIGPGVANNRTSYFNSQSTVLATGGINGQTVQENTLAFGTGAIASSAGCIGDVIYTGGNGGNGRDAGSGAGGGGAGSQGNGGNASTNSAGVGGASYGGNGANGVSPANHGAIGFNYGGGGSGAANSDIQTTDRYGGYGGNGVVIITYGDPDPTTVGVYSNCMSPTTGCYLYDNQGLTLPVGSGYYSNGTYCFTVGSNGLITAIANCNGCPSYGTFAYTSCEFNPSLNCTDTIDYYNDGSCGYYTVPRNICACI